MADVYCWLASHSHQIHQARRVVLVNPNDTTCGHTVPGARELIWCSQLLSGCFQVIVGAVSQNLKVRKHRRETMGAQHGQAVPAACQGTCTCIDGRSGRPWVSVGQGHARPDCIRQRVHQALGDRVINTSVSMHTP